MTGVLDLDDVLALLEEKPMDSPAIAAILRLPADVVHKGLCLAERENRLKRVGTRELWARLEYVGKPGPPPSVDRGAVNLAIVETLRTAAFSTPQLVAQLADLCNHNIVDEQCAELEAAGTIVRVGASRGRRWILADADPSMLAGVPKHTRARILERLAGGPMAMGALKSALERSQNTVMFHLHELQREGAIQMIGTGRWTTWALAGWTPPAAATASPEPTTHDSRPTTFTDEAVRRPARSAAPPKPGLRQTHDRPPSVTVKTELPWWATAPQQGFTATALTHQERMRASKEAGQITPRMLQ